MSTGFIECVLMRPRHHLGRITAAANRFADPQTADMKPSTPDIAEEAAENFTAAAPHEEADRIVVGQAGDGDVVLIDAANNGIAPCPGRIRLGHDFELTHFPHSYQSEAGRTIGKIAAVASHPMRVRT